MLLLVVYLHWVEVSLHGLTSLSGVSHLVDVEAVVSRAQALQSSDYMDRTAWRALQQSGLSGLKDRIKIQNSRVSQSGGLPADIIPSRISL